MIVGPLHLNATEGERKVEKPSEIDSLHLVFAGISGV